MYLTIGITDTEASYQNYPTWIKGNNPDIEIIQLSPANSSELNKCDGIVLSGGVDTHPAFYKNERISYPHAPSQFNEARDAFEISVFKYAQEHQLPVLAICRGMQLVNCILGGDLIQDIEEGGKLDHRKHAGVDGMHEITVLEDSLLFEITKNKNGIVNSAHHQAIGNLANELMVTAYSPDGIAEAAEWKNIENKPFLLCVQWHPERLAKLDETNPFTKNIREQFLEITKNKH